MTNSNETITKNNNIHDDSTFKNVLLITKNLNKIQIVL